MSETEIAKLKAHQIGLIINQFIICGRKLNETQSNDLAKLTDSEIDFLKCELEKIHDGGEAHDRCLQRIEESRQIRFLEGREK
jgi:hypothetical protein